ncbi:fibronectin type III domain-containing protein [Marispirochaeta aestuarii]|uniref:fibronectin type III domain-containing protein n=1 Tax=Marispirochaeta aestuarii TaxID=1963862 RepID=UPI0029C6780B|nr:fibronectin type III domain-containing protein [Marispirochaeta aestuarii]
MKRHRRSGISAILLFTRLYVPIFLLFCPGLYALEEEIVLGRENGWGPLHHYNTEMLEQGFQGYSDIMLHDAAYSRDEYTDLLLHFDSIPLSPSLVRKKSDGPGEVLWTEQRYYTLEPEGIVPDSDSKVFGSGSAMFDRSSRSLLKLVPMPGGLFYPGTDWRDFTIEFWLYPAETESSQKILNWNGVTLPGEWGERPRSQSISCEISRTHLTWRFDSVFRPHDASSFSLELEGRRELMPRRWHHHMLRFDSRTGLVEYLIDGTVEDIAYANHQNRETGTVFLPYLGAAGNRQLSIGENLSGFLDEFRISSAFRESGPPAPYKNMNGTVLIDPVDLQFGASRLVSIESSYETPDDSDIFFFYQLGDSHFYIPPDDPNWKAFTPGDIFSPDTRGRYLHLMAALYPDGKEQKSPVLSDITIIYEPDLPPPPPSGLQARPEDGAVLLTWEPVPDPDLEGYRIYYGTAPGRYFGQDSTEGPSPIDVGNTTEFLLSGLRNGRLYYFTVAAYDKSPRPYQTLFSAEVSARPNGRLE